MTGSYFQIMSKTLQFEVWHTCRNRCKFCYLQGDQETPRLEMIKNIKNAHQTIVNKEIWNEYDTVSFIGGEIFQGEMDNEFIQQEWVDLIKTISKYHEDGLIKKVYFCATLTFDNNDALWHTLSQFNSHREGVWVLTSYDEEGRFHTPQHLKNWQENIKKIRNEFVGIQINTTVICTATVCEKYLEDRDYFNKLRGLGTQLFLKVPSRPKLYKTNKEANEKMGINFFPTRKLFMNFLIKLANEDINLYEKLCDIDLRADTLIGKWKDKDFVSTRDKSTYMELYDDETEYVMKCGHISTYNAYLDENGCALCDIQAVKDMVNG